MVLLFLTPFDMSNLADVRMMSVNEYCNWVESRALHYRVSPMELNILHVENELISWFRYEEAKSELNARANENYWLQRGEVVR